MRLKTCRRMTRHRLVEMHLKTCRRMDRQRLVEMHLKTCRRMDRQREVEMQTCRRFWRRNPFYCDRQTRHKLDDRQRESVSGLLDVSRTIPSISFWPLNPSTNQALSQSDGKFLMMTTKKKGFYSHLSPFQRE